MLIQHQNMKDGVYSFLTTNCQKKSKRNGKIYGWVDHY